MRRLSLVLLALVPSVAQAEWKVLPPTSHRQPLPKEIPADLPTIKPKDKWPNDNQFRWLVGELTLPDTINGQPSAGKPVGLQFNCGDGGEIHYNGELQARYDNDHPALILLAERANPGAKVRVDVLVYAKVQGGDDFGEANFVLIEPRRAIERLTLNVDPKRALGPVPDGIIGLSQGGGMSDYDDATARKLREGGFRWFRMDNILTQTVRKGPDGQLAYDFADLDRRVDFITSFGAEPILAASYMPEVFDAIPNTDRQSAPRDYGQWEDLCFRAARRCLERGKRVPFWEVWNEPNTGWIKAGPEDKGTDAFKKLYQQATGRDNVEAEIVRRFEAYCKLYAATARGVRRADPQALVGGPALASGPFDDDKLGPGVNGKGFARGLMLYCRQEKLPLDFLSWHEYFHPSDVIAKEADAFREYLKEFPEFQQPQRPLMITEWNEAWWTNRPMDHEIGAAWCADGVVRAILPRRIDRPCFFYVKQNDTNFRGDFSLLMKDNVPKPSFHMAAVFNNLSGDWLEITGGDDDVCGVAAWDAKKGRLAVVLVNYRFRHAFRRTVRVKIDALPAELAGGKWRECIIDATHSNVWHDAGKPELFQGRTGELTGDGFTWEAGLGPNSITLVELTAK